MSAFSTHLKRLTVAMPVLIGLARNAYALDPLRPVTQYVREKWGLRNGLPRGQISSITQTSDGFLWIGTEQGLCRFDGVTFTSARDSGPQSLTLDRVLGLAADSAGNLWIRLPEPTLVRYQNQSFTSMRLRPNVDALATAMAAGINGTLLVATRLDGILRWNGTYFETIAPKSSLPSSPIISIGGSASGDVWLGTVDVGLLRLKDGVITSVTAGLPDLKVNSVSAGTPDELYVGTNRGLARWDGKQFTQSGLSKRLREARILTLARDRDANL